MKNTTKHYGIIKNKSKQKMSAVRKIPQSTKEDIDHFVTIHMGEEKNTWKHQRHVQKSEMQRSPHITHKRARGNDIRREKRQGGYDG